MLRVAHGYATSMCTSRGRAAKIHGEGNLVPSQGAKMLLEEQVLISSNA